MGKSQHVGTSADDLRRATQEANAAMKDLQAAAKEAREAKRELAQAAEGYLSRALFDVKRELDANRKLLSADLDDIAQRAVSEISRRIETKAAVLADSVKARLKARGTSAEGTFATLRGVLGEIDTELSDEMAMPPAGVDMRINDRDIVQGIPVVTTGMQISDGSDWPKPGPHDAKRPCGTCDRMCWLNPKRIAAVNQGADILCVVCTSMLIKLIRESGIATVFSSKDGSQYTREI